MKVQHDAKKLKIIMIGKRMDGKVNWIKKVKKNGNVKI
jgi:hypothetical protein